MVKNLCAGLAAAAVLASAMAAGAADLSMTPIYKARPSIASEVNGSLKAEYRSFHLHNSGLQEPFAQDLSAYDATASNAHAGNSKPLGTLNDRAVQAGADNRF